jgi:predicted DNA-binding protein (UPF0251 family)
MAGSRKITRWQESAYNKMMDAIKLPDFQKDVEQIREETEESPVLNERTLQLIVKYDLPRLCFVLIREYVLFGTFRPPEEIPPPIMLLSFADRYVGPHYEMPIEVYMEHTRQERVLIDITGEVQKQDILDFVNQNWKLIESKLKLLEPQRPGAVKLKQVDKLHLEVLRLREEEGLRYKEIAARLNLTEPNVTKILQRMRKVRKNRTNQK